RRRAVRRGGLPQGLPRVLGRVPGVRGRDPPGPPAVVDAGGAGVVGAVPGPVRRPLRRLRPRRPSRSVLRAAHYRSSMTLRRLAGAAAGVLLLTAAAAACSDDDSVFNADVGECIESLDDLGT